MNIYFNSHVQNPLAHRRVPSAFSPSVETAGKHTPNSRMNNKIGTREKRKGSRHVHFADVATSSSNNADAPFLPPVASRQQENTPSRTSNNTEAKKKGKGFRHVHFANAAASYPSKADPPPAPAPPPPQLLIAEFAYNQTTSSRGENPDSTGSQSSTEDTTERRIVKIKSQPYHSQQLVVAQHPSLKAKDRSSEKKAISYSKEDAADTPPTTSARDSSSRAKHHYPKPKANADKHAEESSTQQSATSAITRVPSSKVKDRVIETKAIADQHAELTYSKQTKIARRLSTKAKDRSSNTEPQQPEKSFYKEDPHQVVPKQPAKTAKDYFSSRKEYTEKIASVNPRHPRDNPQQKAARAEKECSPTKNKIPEKASSRKDENYHPRPARPRQSRSSTNYKLSEGNSNAENTQQKQPRSYTDPIACSDTATTTPKATHSLRYRHSRPQRQRPPPPQTYTHAQPTAGPPSSDDSLYTDSYAGSYTGARSTGNSINTNTTSAVHLTNPFILLLLHHSRFQLYRLLLIFL
ncbi:unnamed protein product [Periconia digitata]|uniref:Uncharacterized protein n=1 Tax=Periconia digitata TaxID=1303443 RepID=A0A9W4UF55_9PLEO|nr:unnamed protein product [Periconia digitata]